MDKEELKEVMRLLKEAGIDAQLCDTPVPVSANPARCGWPEDLEDECIDDYILLPKAVVGQYPEMFIPAIGDSMIEAGYAIEADSTYILLGIAMAAMETSTRLHYHEIYNVMQKFNIKIV